MTVAIEQLNAAHRATWASGDYAAVAKAFVLDVGATAVARAALEPGTEVLDVATGDNYGPVLKARERLAKEGRWTDPQRDLVALCERGNVAEHGYPVPSEYLPTLGRRSG